ncbi:MAG: hypothetical protein IJR55_02450 [Clostridia bacterium]|nr:hypothetical protein [Clostridia bacterium]
MKKARLFLIMALTALFVLSSVFTASAAESSTFKATLTGTPSMAKDQTAVFTVSITDVSVYNGMGEVNIDVKIPTDYLQYVVGTAKAVSTPNAEWGTSASYSNGVLSLDAYCSKLKTTSALFGNYDEDYTLKANNELVFTFVLRCVSDEEGKNAAVTFDNIGGRDYIRSAVTGEGNAASVKITQVKAARPEAPTEMKALNKPEGSVYLNYQRNVEFSYDLISWQTSTVFTGLPMNNVYFFYARTAATALAAASDPSAPLSVTLGTATVNTDPNAELEYNNDISVIAKTSNSITLQYVAGRTYSIDGKNWQENATFSSLEPSTKYVIRAKETSTGRFLETLNVTTLSLEANLPAAPTLASKTDTTVTLNEISGNEYSSDGKTWQKSPVFTGLTPSTTYKFYTRKAGTIFIQPGETSKELTVTTDAPKACEHTNTRAETKDSTCRENGYERIVCIDCGAVLSSKELPLSEHNAEWHVVKKATCTEDGQRELFCKVCWQILQRETVPAEGHDENDVKIVKAATDTEDGLREVRCSKDGALIRSEIIPKTGSPAETTTESTPASTTVNNQPGTKPTNNANVVLIVIILVLVAVIASIVIIFVILYNGSKKKKSK